jgi:Subtilase family
MLMTTRMRQTAALGLVAIAAGFLMLCAQAARAETVSPLPASNYAVRAACKPPSEGHATCLALQLVPTTAAARARTHPLGVTLNHAIPARSAKEGDYGLTPAELHSAYAIPASAAGTQTIALVDAYNDPNAASDLKAYETEFGLTGCKEVACFTRVNEKGETANLPFPQNDAELETALESGTETAKAEEAAGWDVEISLDIEAARATCENCHILLVEASSTEDGDLSRAEDWAAEHGGAEEISNSWGGPEGESATPFDHPGIAITASAGDDGYRSWNAAEEYAYTSFPASSPDVVAVGGTRLMRSGGKWQSETVWNDGGESGGVMDGYGATGGGCSESFTAQPWQQHVADWSKVGCGTKRAVADVAADGDPLTGFALRDTNPVLEVTPQEEVENHHWYTYGGTSLSSPIIASTFALAGGSGGVAYPAETLYGKAKVLPASLHDITASTTNGSNGKCSRPFDEETFLTACTPEQEANASCSGELICIAHSGYDGPSGVGSPEGLEAFEPLTAEQSAELTKTEEAEAVTRGEEQREAEETEEAEEAVEEERAKAKEKAKERTHGFPPPENTNSTVATTWPAPGTTATNTGPTAVQLAGLALTPRALVALNRRRPKISQLAFQFTASVATHVSVSLQERVGKRRHRHWKLVQRSSAAAVAGHDSRRLAGARRLSVGSYRLTVTPTGGTARSLSFNIG